MVHGYRKKRARAFARWATNSPESVITAGKLGTYIPIHFFAGAPDYGGGVDAWWFAAGDQVFLQVTEQAHWPTRKPGLYACKREQGQLSLLAVVAEGIDQTLFESVLAAFLRTGVLTSRKRRKRLGKRYDRLTDTSPGAVNR